MEDAMFDKLCESIEQATAHAKDEEDLREDQIHFVDEPDPRSIRNKLNLTQREFAGLLDVSVDTVRNWEQGRRQPQGPAEMLLRVADQKPQALLDILGRTEEEFEEAEEATPTNKICYLAKQRSRFSAVEREREVMHTRTEIHSASKGTKFSFQKRRNKRPADDYSYAMAV
jgi:putative transcriptional regulator